MRLQHIAVAGAVLAFAFSAHAATSAGADGDPYTLSTCPVLGQELGSMGDTVVAEYDGREVRFCCGACVAVFEEDQDTYWAEIDEAIIEQQMAYYPLEVCLNSGEPLDSAGEPVDHVYRNRLVRFCSEGCQSAFEENTSEMLAQLDEAVVEAQLPDYELETCPVMDVDLGSMGGAVDYVVANQLVRLCCAGCPSSVHRNPLEYIDTE